MRWLQNFMYGRYGLDDLGKLNLAAWAVLAIVNIFVRSKIIYIIYLLLCIICLLRMFSKNIPARQKENDRFLRIFGKAKTNMYEVKTTAEKQKQKAADSTHKYIKCKICGANLRVSREKGTHTVKCPKCGSKFKLRIWF